MVNLYFDICAFILIGIVLIANFIKGVKKDRTTVLFSLLLILLLFSTLGDFMSGYICNYGEITENSRAMCYLVNYIYFLAHNNLLPLLILFIYSNVGAWHLFKENKLLVAVFSGIVCFVNIVLILNLFLNNVFIITEDVQYERGPMILVFYICAGLFMIMGISAIIKYRKLISTDKFVGMLSLYPITIIGIVIQAIYDSLLVEMFSLSVAIIIFSIVVRQPEGTLDPTSGAKKYSVGLEKMHNLLTTKMPIQIVLIRIANFRNLRVYLGQELYNEFLHQITEKLEAVTNKEQLSSEIYYLRDGLYALLTESKDDYLVGKVANIISEYFMDELNVDNFSVLTDARICIIKCPKDIDEYSTLFTFGSIFHTVLPESREVFMYSDFANNKEFKIKNELDDIIARGLRERRYEMYYQPIYSTIENRFVSAEALIRLKDDKYGAISPGLFIPAAELSGAIHAIGDFVLEDVCRFISQNNFYDLGLSYIEINMSASQCIEIDLVDKVTDLLNKYDVDASKIMLEITESAADIDPEIVDQNIYKLYDLGVHFSLDDYGTGYSNIKRVTSLPIDIVKLDKAFVDGIDDPQMWIMVQDTIKMLKEMEKQVLVEGVEEENVVKKFMELGCDYIQGCEYMQGFYFCKPLPEREFIEFLRSQIEAD